MLIKNKKIKLINLGCRVNLFETSAVAHELKKEGAKLTINLNNADICVINTCCVTSRADAKSNYFINKASKHNNIKLIVVMGCYSQLNNILNSKVGIVIGTKYKNQLVNLIKQYQNRQIIKIDQLVKNDRFENFDESILYINTRAFLKIQDGCDFMCSYCLIPFARGRQRSLNHELVLKNIQNLIDKNYKEIVLSGVNVAGYNDGEYNFYQLLKAIDKIEGKFRVRISSVEPFQIDNKIIDLITSNPNRWCQQLHICIQSASDQVIKDMRRKYTIKDFKKMCTYARNKNPLISITTDYIAGFPTETKKYFDESMENLKKIKFASMHIFPYSKRPNTYASSLNNLVSDNEKKERFDKVQKLKNNMQKQYLRHFINKKIKVLFEKSNEKNIQIGHSEYFFSVKVKTNKALTNRLLNVKIIDIKNNQTLGELI